MDLSKFARRCVQRSVAEVHVAHDSSESLIGLWLDFGDGKSVTLDCDSDGESLRISSSEMPRNYDMDQNGRVEVRDGALADGSTIEKAIPMVDDDDITFGVYRSSITADISCSTGATTSTCRAHCCPTYGTPA